MVIGTLTRLLYIASRVACLLAVAWFVTFAVQQSGTAAAHQASEIYPAGAQAQSQAQAPAPESGLRKTLNDAFKAISSPFSGVMASSHSQWTVHIVDTLLALLVYGFGIGYLARAVRMMG